MIDYKCSKCGATGVKLWRDICVFASDVELQCAECATDEHVDDAGKYVDKWGMRSDQVAGLLPAVPADGGATFWGYTSVPPGPLSWWKSLPTYRAQI